MANSAHAIHYYYAQTSKKLTEHNGFGLSVRPCVRACVRPYVRSWHFLMHAISYEPSLLGFWNFIYGFLMAGIRIFSYPSYLPFWRYAPLKKSEWNLMHAISYESCMLGFWNRIWIPHGKKTNQYFYSCLNYLPLWSYVPLKNQHWNTVLSARYRKKYLS